jgi:cyclopropane fatty-acyl-phospholipid synthase-like methyltransferase
MKIKKKHNKDVSKIMGVEKEMIRLLPMLHDVSNMMNPNIRQLSGIFRGLKFKKGMEILDIPCGKGGVSVPLAKKYGVKVMGFDILPEYVRIANEFAKRHGVEKHCNFKIGDIRDVVKRENICDVLLWIAPPHLWGKSKPTIKALRNCVKNGGLIFINDAYTYSKKNPSAYDDYETLNETNKGYTFYGDEVVRFIDYRSKLWENDYKRAKESAQKALKNANDGNKQVIRRYMKSLDEDEKNDTKYLGVAIWIICINKTI